MQHHNVNIASEVGTQLSCNCLHMLNIPVIDVGRYSQPPSPGMVLIVRGAIQFMHSIFVIMPILDVIADISLSMATASLVLRASPPFGAGSRD